MKVTINLSKEDEKIIKLIREETGLVTNTRVVLLALQCASRDEEFYRKLRRLSKHPKLDYFDII